MMKSFATLLLATLLVVAAIVRTDAHHGQAGLFDESKVVELKGTVKKWSLVNPHPILLLEVTDESGMKVDYDVYFGPSAAGPLRPATGGGASSAALLEHAVVRTTSVRTATGRAMIASRRAKVSIYEFRVRYEFRFRFVPVPSSEFVTITIYDAVSGSVAT